MTFFPEQGTWVRWLTSTHGREGEVIRSQWPSLTIQWLGVEEPQVFPYGYIYFDDEYPSSQMEVIDPPSVSIPDAPAGGDRPMTPKQAAAVLGIDMKILRQRLRSGKVKGLQRDGRWVQVYL